MMEENHVKSHIQHQKKTNESNTTLTKNKNKTNNNKHDKNTPNRKKGQTNK